MRAAIYARVSTLDQEPENQLQELRRYAEARGWTVVEYIDHGISGSKESRPALDRLMQDAKRRTIDAVICWRLDRFGRNLRHIVTALDELQAAGVTFISLGEGIDLSTPAGRLQLHILAALAQFERERIRERIHAGLARARKLGHRPGPRCRQLAAADLEQIAGLSVRAAAARLGVSAATVHRARAAASVSDPPPPDPDFRRGFAGPSPAA